jgi:epoxide hydrolase 4
MMTPQDAETVYSSPSRRTAGGGGGGGGGGSSFRERRTTPWKHREAVVNGIRIHYVEAEPTRRVQSPLADHDSTEAPGQSSSEPASSAPAQPPLLLLLHGFPEFYFSWRFQITSFAAAGYRVVAPDLRGYNLSEKPATGYAINALVEDVRLLILHLTSDEHPQRPHDRSPRQEQPQQDKDMEVAERTDVGNVYLMGHVWGGVLASAVAARYPQLVSKLVMVESVHLAALETARLQKKTPPPSRITSIGSVIRYCPPVLPELLLSYNRSWLLSSLFCPSAQHKRGENQSSRTAPCELPAEAMCCTVSTTNVPEDAAPHNSEDELYRDAMSQPGAVACMLAYFRCLPTSLKQSRAYEKIRCPVLVVWGTGEDPELDDDAIVAKSHVDVLQGVCELAVELCLIPRTSTAPSRQRRWIHEDESNKVNECVLRFFRTRAVLRRATESL